MSELRNLIENIIKERLNFIKEDNEDVVYRTYANGKYLNDITFSFANKPKGGLWGCRDDSWKEWCNDNDFNCSTDYYEWKLKPGTKVFTIDSEDDFFYLLKNYGTNSTGLYKTEFMIDFMKLSKDYDAVELTPEGNNRLHFGVTKQDPELQGNEYKMCLMLALNAWDVPSICVFHPKETVEVINSNF